MPKWKKCFFFWLLLVSDHNAGRSVHSATHLFATDEKIHSRVDSPYNIRNYDDVFELVDQESKIQELRDKQSTLENLRDRLDHLMNKDEDIDVEQAILRSDSDCKRAGNLYKKLNLFESVVISLEIKGFKTRNFIKAGKYKKAAPQWFPECLDYVEPDATSEFIDTLPGFRNRRELSAAPEKMIVDVLAGFTVTDYGNAVAEALKTNKTSWVLLNLAAFYHRMNGDAYFGLECAKRAFHYSPKEHKDIALISIASLLYRGNHPEDALTIARATPNICGDSSMAPAVYTLTGLILASISDFDAAVEAFTSAIKHTKQPEVLHSYRYAIKCHAKVHEGLSEQHKDLKEIISQFENVGVLAKKVDKLHQDIQDTRAGPVADLQEAFGDRNGGGSRSFHRDGSYNIDNSDGSESKYLPTWKNGLSLHSPTTSQKFRQSPQPVSEYKHYFLSNDWPPEEECDTLYGREANLAAITSQKLSASVMIPLENKGFRFWDVIGTLNAIKGVPLPYCENTRYRLPTTTAEQMGNFWANDLGDVLSPDKDMQKAIWDYMSMCGSLEDFGRKVTLAYTLDLMPPWMFFSAAALYWRAAGVTSQAAECLGRAYNTMPTEYEDVALVGIASFLRFSNRTDPLMPLTRKLEEISKEPASFYILGTTYAYHGLLSLSIRNFRLALQQDPSFYPAWEAYRTTRCLMMTMTPTERLLMADDEIDPLESFKNGMVEIGFGFMNPETAMRGSVNVLKESITTILRNNELGEQLTDRLKLALNTLNSKKPTTKAIKKRGR